MNQGRSSMVITSKMIRKNKALRAIRKQSLKMFGKVKKGVIKNKIGKAVACESGMDAEMDWKKISGDLEQFLENNRVSLAAKPDAKTLIEACKEAGLTGMSGNGFPVYQKLEGFLQSDASSKHIIINGVECEPGLIHDQWLIDHHLDVIVKAAGILGKIFDGASVAIAAKGFPAAKGTIPTGVSLYQVPPVYPMGEEHILIRQVLGVILTPEETPIEKGILVMNVQTLIQMFRVLSGESVNGRYVTLCDLDTGKAVAAYVDDKELIKDKLLGVFGQREYYKCGFGVMYANDVSGQDTFSPTICFAAVASSVAGCSTENKCKGCGRCKRVCPMDINVKKVITSLEKHQCEKLDELGVGRCIGCGSCSFVCAAGKSPHEMIGEYNAKIKG